MRLSLFLELTGQIQNLFQELEDAKKDTYKIQKFLWHWILSHLQKKVLNFFAMEFVYLFHQKNKEKTKSLFSRGTRYCVCDGLELVIGTWK